MLKRTEFDSDGGLLADLLREDVAEIPVANPEPGVFVGPLNMNYLFDVVESYPKIEALSEQVHPTYTAWFPYGVHDSVEAFMDAYREALVSDPREFVVLFTKMSRDEQPESGGWRWHKWGPMLGEQEPTTEYLYDEPAIEEVVVFHVHEVRLLP